MIPSIDLANQDTTLVDGVPKTAAQAARLFLEHGVLLVENAFDARYLSRLHDAFTETYSEHFVEAEVGDHRRVGHRRNMLTLELKGQFNAPELYANPGLMPILELLLGRSLIMNNMTSVTSLPGSVPQDLHRDHANIYLTESNSHLEDDWLRHTPPYAISVGIPLVPITEENGCTVFWPGTHVRKVEPRDPNIGPGQRYTCELGTCVLFDYRIIHRGAANRSDQPRPLVYCVYSCDWFRDALNFRYEQDPLSITPVELQKVPKAHRHLFNWAFNVKSPIQ